MNKLWADVIVQGWEAAHLSPQSHAYIHRAATAHASFTELQRWPSRSKWKGSSRLWPGAEEHCRFLFVSPRDVKPPHPHLPHSVGEKKYN